jgi:hypothetical protein
MNYETREADGKTDYEPPRLTVISLRPEEAVLGHCKSTTSGGPAASPCFPFCASSVGS